MNDYPTEWLHERPHSSDPRLSDVLDDYQPTAATRARVADLWRLYAAREPEAVHVLLDLAADSMDALTDDHRAVVRVLLALLEQATTTTIGALGEALAVGRIGSIAREARADALDEAAAS